MKHQFPFSWSGSEDPIVFSGTATWIVDGREHSINFESFGSAICVDDMIRMSYHLGYEKAKRQIIDRFTAVTKTLSSDSIS